MAMSQHHRNRHAERFHTPKFHGQQIDFPGSDYCSFKGSVSRPSPYKTVKMMSGKESDQVLQRAQQAQVARTSAAHHKAPPKHIDPQAHMHSNSAGVEHVEDKDSRSM